MRAKVEAADGVADADENDDDVVPQKRLMYMMMCNAFKDFILIHQ